MVRLAYHDALPHLLALHWLVELFHTGFDRPEELFGAHPGVEFIEDGVVIGEADVVLLFSDGDLVLGECKRSAAGLSEAGLDKLGHLADRTGAAWTFVATTTPSEECPSIWRDSVRPLPERPNFALTAEHLFSLPIWTIEENALAWRNAEGRGSRSRATGSSLESLLQWWADQQTPDYDITARWNP